MKMYVSQTSNLFFDFRKDNSCQRTIEQDYKCLKLGKI